MRALIPAAGLGTRRLPATRAQPKELLPVVDRPALEYVVAEAAASGVDEVVIVVGPTKRAIRDHMARVDPRAYGGRVPPRLRATADLLDRVSIRFLVQREPRGLGHAVYQARRLFRREPFAVLLGDDLFVGPEPCTRRLVRVHARVGGHVVAVERKPRRDLGRYGVVDLARRRGPAWPVRGLVEKPAPGQAPSHYVAAGRYVLGPDVFDVLRRTPPGRGGEVQLTDALDALARRGCVHAVRAPTRRIDVGGTVDWILANVELGLRDPRYRRDLQAGLRRVVR